MPSPEVWGIYPAVHKLAALDQQYVWHPFTQMKDWLKAEPIVITRGKGALVYDQKGKEYIDANSSIWTNLHGHQNRAINKGIVGQLKKIAHSSALGLANEPASLLAEKLVLATGEGLPMARSGRGTAVLSPVGERKKEALAKVFYSDDGSTAMEVALKLSHEYWRRQGVAQPQFLSLGGAYHGDTVGAVSLGHIDLFHKTYGPLLFKTERVMSPYCYRCPYNQAKPERADARSYRKCNWECVGQVEEAFRKGGKTKSRITAFVAEPAMQGAAGMIPQPEGWLRKVAEITRGHEAHFILDEVMTGFGRTHLPTAEKQNWFAFQKEGVAPDFVAVAKGLTGGYLPLAATLTTQSVFDAFLGEYEEFRTFFHGHSYTANQLGCAAGLASLEVLSSAKSKAGRAELEGNLAAGLNSLWDLPEIGDIRREGLVAGIELVRDWKTRRPFDLRERVGIRVCEGMTRRGVLTRPIGNVIVIMPPYCTTPRQLKKTFEALRDSLGEVRAEL